MRQHLARAELAYDNKVIFGRVAVNYMSKRYFTYTNDQYIGGRTLVDASLGYRVKTPFSDRPIELQVNATNLFDVKYVSTMGTNGFGFSGDAQTLMVARRARCSARSRRGSDGHEITHIGSVAGGGSIPAAIGGKTRRQGPAASSGAADLDRRVAPRRRAGGGEAGLKVPALRALVADGAHASGVVGVLPTLTFPSHTTLITGVDPARHGVFNNVTLTPPPSTRTAGTGTPATSRCPPLGCGQGARPFHRQCPLAGQRGRGYPLEPAPDLAHGSCR
jgi:hypothetical protein